MSTQQDIYAAGSESCPPMLNKENYVSWSSRLLQYAKSRPNGKLIHKSIINGPYVRRMIPELDPTTAMNMELALMAKAFKLNYLAPTNNNHRISSNPRNRRIAQPGMNMGQDRQMQMVGGNGRNQFRQYTRQNAGNLNGYNDVQNIGNQNLNGNGYLVAARAEGNVAGQNGNQIRSAEVHDYENYDDNEKFNMFTQEEQYTELLEPIPESHQIPQNDNNVISEVISMEQSGETVEQHPENVKETRALYDSLYQNLVIKVEKVNKVNRKLKETNVDLTTELARVRNQEKCFEISQEKYKKLERCYQQSVYQEQCLSKKINALHLSSEETLQLTQESRQKMKQLNKEIKPANYTKINHLSGVFVSQMAKSREELYFSDISKSANVSKPISIPNEEFSDDTTPSVGRKFLNEVKSTIVTLKRVVKHRMNLETHNWSSSAHQELYKIVKDENFPIVNQIDGRVQNFEIQFFKEAAKFVGDFKSLTKESDESLAKHKALELKIERLLRAVVSQDIMCVVQNNSVVDVSNLQTDLEHTKERFENSYNDMQHKIKRLQAQLGDLKGKSKDTSGIDNSKTRRPQPRSNTKNDRAPSTSRSSQNKNKGVKVEEHHRNLLLSKNNKHMSSACNNFKLDSQNVISKVVCAMCKKCLMFVNHDVCLRKYVNGKTSRGKKQKENVSIKEKQKKQQPKDKKTKNVGFIKRLATPKPSKPRCFLRWSPTGRLFDLKGKIIESSKSESQSDCSNGDNACTPNTLEPKIKWFLNSTSFLGKLSKFVYGQFCDLDLEVAFRRNACFVRNLEGVDLLKGDRSTNLYTINLHDMASTSPIFLMARASSTKSWLGHQRLSHLNFDTINDLAKNDLVTGLLKFKYHKEHLCSSCEQGKTKRASHPPKPVPNSRQRLHLLYTDLCGPMRIASINGKWITVLFQSPVIIIRTDNDTEFKNQVLKEYFDSVGISHQVSSIQTPQQNRLVEHRNRTKSDISFVYVFGALCYPKNDREDIVKLGAKGDIGFFIGYSADSCAYRVYNRRTKKIMETMNVSFDELSAMAFEQRSSKPRLQSMTSGQISSGLDLTYAPSTIITQQPTEGELDLLFEAMYDDYIGGQSSATVRTVLDTQAPQVRQTSTTSTSIADTAPTPTNSSSNATNFPNTSHDVDELNPNAMFNGNTFVNPFANPSTSAAKSSSSQNVDPSNMHTFYQPYTHEFKWTKDHPLEQVNHFFKGTIDPTLFIRRFDTDILVVHVYVDDIIFGSTHPRYTQLFSDLIKSYFEMSMIGEMTFFLGLQVNQSLCGIFINHSNYVLEILKKYGMEYCDPVGTPMEIKDKLDLDQHGTPVNVTKYCSMIGTLMYLTSSRPDIVHTTCLCARYQAKPTEKHLKEVKKIFRYLWGTVNTGLWYTRDSGFELTGFLDADYAGCKDAFKSTFGGA
nr:hypothetical protein [Tanacetum cinerariifolium]